MPFGALGKAIGGLGNKMMNAPGMGAIRKPLQAGMKAPGMKPVAKGLGLGPSQPPQQGGGIQPGMQNWGAPSGPMPQRFGGASGMQNAVQNAGNAIGQAFNRPQPMQMQAPPLQTPEPSAPASSDVQNQENTPEMMQAKQNQLTQMAQTFGNQLGGMFGGGMARPLPYQRGDMGGGQQMMPQGPMPMPDESVDQFRKNKFQQMRRGGIGPRMQPEPMQQKEPQQY